MPRARAFRKGVHHEVKEAGKDSRPMGNRQRERALQVLAHPNKTPRAGKRKVTENVTNQGNE